MRKHLALAASALAIGLASTSAASAQDYGRMVSFGDSLSDIGNLYAAAGQPISPPYFQGRFSNGPVWLELLGFTQARFGGSVTGSINYAYGGSRTDNTVAFPTGMRQQITNYLGAGGTFDDDDLVTIWGGANNIFQGMGPASVSPDPFGAIATTSTLAAADMSFMVNQVANAGAGTILVANLPNLGATPQFGGTAAQGLSTHATNVFNAALFAQMTAQAAAHPNTNIIFMDVHRAFSVVQSAPGRFGFTNITQTCLVGATACSTPDTYSYWDSVHPTAAGHRLIASVATDYLYYADFGSHSAVQGEIASREREDGLSASTARLGHGDFAGRAGGVYVTGTFSQGSLDARGDIQGGDVDGQGLTIGVESNIGDTLRGGVSFSARTADVDLTLVDFSAEGAGFDAYLGWRSGGMFVNAAAGWTADQYEDIQRQTATANVIATASTSGSSMGARIEGGYAFGMGGDWTVAPRIGLSWASTDVDGYVEENAFGAQHQFDDRSVEVISADVAVRAEGDMGGFGVWGEVGYRDALDYSGDPVVVRIAGNTAQPLSVDPGDPNGGQVLLEAGVRGSWGPADLSVGYRGRQGDSFDNHTALAQVTLRF